MKQKLLLLSILPVLLCGCSTFQNRDPINYAPSVQAAAEEGTKYAVAEHPEWKPKFLAAANELDVLAGADVIDFRVLFQIVDRLPVKELKSNDAKLAIAGGKIILAILQMEIPLDKVEKYRVIVEAFRDGILKGLEPQAGFKPTHAPSYWQAQTAEVSDVSRVLFNN